jgi:uncharacterized protein (DUF305 family)
MKITKVTTLSLVFTVALLGASCQNPSSNVATANGSAAANQSNANHSDHDMSAMNHDMSNMQGHDMMNMNSDPNAAEQPYDLQFLDSMAHHHDGAVTMAKMVLGKTERPELKAFAQKIIDDQTKEKEYLKKLRDEWYPGKPSAVNMEMSGMIGGMKMMNGEHMKEMGEMEPNHFDGHFLKMMIAHHEGAITMAKEAEQKAEHPELKKLSADIIKAQQPEIDQMKKWQDAWDK